MSDPAYLKVPDLPRILLVDCADDLYEAVRSSGYTVARGDTGDFVGRDAPTLIPTLHETDVLIIDWDPGAERVLADHNAMEEIARGGRKESLFAPFGSCFQRGAIAICLLDVRYSPFEKLNFLPYSQARAVGYSIDQHQRLTERCVESYPELAQLFQDHRDALTQHRALAVYGGSSDPLLENEAGEFKAIFESIGAGGVFFLPRFDRKVIAVRRLLRDVLPQLSPHLFPERPDEWLDKDDYQSDTVIRIRRSISDAQEEYDERLAHLRDEEERERLGHAPMRALLTAESHDLRQPVQLALEKLGFEVRDMDEVNQLNGKNPEEDFQIKDDTYFAVVEVTSGKGNAREKDLGDLLKYVHRRMKDSGRDDVAGVDTRGLLVMNQHVLTEPTKRARLYESSEQSQTQAREMDVGLLATWDLFQIVRAVDAGQMSKEAARELIKAPGLVEFDAPVNVTAA